MEIADQPAPAAAWPVLEAGPPAPPPGPGAASHGQAQWSCRAKARGPQEKGADRV